MYIFQTFERILRIPYGYVLPNFLCNLFLVGSISPWSTENKTTSFRQFLLEPLGRRGHCMVYYRGHLTVQPLHPEGLTDSVHFEHRLLLYKDPGNFVR